MLRSLQLQELSGIVAGKVVLAKAQGSCSASKTGSTVVELAAEKHLCPLESCAGASSGNQRLGSGVKKIMGDMQALQNAINRDATDRHRVATTPR